MPGDSVSQFSSVQGVFYKCSLRHWQQHKWQAILMLIGMSLGVAVVFAVDIANNSAKRAFTLSLDTVTGRTTHQIVGGADGIDEQLYATLRTELGFRRSAPILEGRITLKHKDNTSNYSESLQLLGVDIFAEPMFREQSTNSTTNTRDSLKLLRAGSVILADTTALRLGVKPGELLTISNSAQVTAQATDQANNPANNSVQTLTLLSTVKTRDQPGFENIAMVDIATAQQILNKYGKLSRIDLILPDSDSPSEEQSNSRSDASANKSVIEQLESALPGVTVIDAARRNNSLTQMTDAFHTNLLAMSLLALLVGAFLIYNTVTLSVIQRRQTFGQLRTLGIQRHELFRSILTETLIFAVIGTLAGLMLGYLLGSVLLTLVTRTINDLYFTLDVRQVGYSALTGLKACAIGLGVSLLAALAPAIEASRSAPAAVVRRTTVEKRVSRLVPKIFIGGIALIVVGFIVLWISSASLWAAFVAIFLIVIGYSLIIPQLIIAITSAGNYSALASVGTMGNYPLRSMTSGLSRTAVAIAALSVSVAATAGVGIMIGSFRLSVENWLGNTLQADVYINATSSDQNPDAVLPQKLLNNIQSMPELSGSRVARLTEVDTNLAPARLLAVQSSGNAKLNYEFIEINQSSENKESMAGNAGDKITDEDKIPLLFNTDAVIISEPFARKNNAVVGSEIGITSDKGVIPFQVTGIFTNYTTGKGLIVMSLPAYHKYWGDRSIDSIGVNFTENADPASVTKRLRSLIVESNEPITLRSDIDIREQSLEIFDRTFAITHVLRLLTVGVAFVGILSALMALSLERRAEYAVLRALGITPSELRNLLFVQTGLMGIIAGVLALPLGIAMSQILVSVINVRSFGWSMAYKISPTVLAESLLLAFVAALLAGLYPAHKLSRLSPAEALRHQ